MLQKHQTQMAASPPNTHRCTQQHQTYIYENASSSSISSNGSSSISDGGSSSSSSYSSHSGLNLLCILYVLGSLMRMTQYASNLVGSISQQSASSLIMRVLNDSGTGFLSAFGGLGNDDDDDDDDGDEDYEDDDDEEEVDDDEEEDDGEDLVDNIYFPRSNEEN